MSASGYIAFDLDATLAEYATGNGIVGIGKPVPLMVARAKKYIAEGVEIRIMTARASLPDQIPLIQDWCEEQGLGRPKVTDKKDWAMITLYDDRARQVLPNKGIVVGEVDGW